MSDPITTPTDPTPADRLWTAEDVAAFLGASVSWVRQQTRKGLIPYSRIVSFVRYDPAEIRALHERFRVQKGKVLVLRPARPAPPADPRPPVKP
jgi:hypothetical protein